MNKFVLAAVAATAGCTAASSSPDLGLARDDSSRIATRASALAAAPAALGADGGLPDKDDVGKKPRLRKATPSAGPSNGGPLAGASGSTVPSAAWQALTNPAPLYAGTALLLTDGTVLVQDAGDTDWWKLTPDALGSYLDGTWSQVASPPGGYAPLYFGSAVLPDGRVIVEGGEYQYFDPEWSTQGAVYDPTTNVWTAINPPAGWDTIGDAASVVLPDGRYLLSNCCTLDAAILDPKTLTWSPFGTGKADIYNEEGWTLLQNGEILTVDANNTTNLTLAEILNPRSGKWSSAGSTLQPLADLGANGAGSHELGPQVVRPDGTVFVAGATGHTAIYHPSGRWTKGPDFPVIAGEGQLDVADGPATLLPNGHVLVAASPGVFNSPLHVFDFDGASLTEVGAPPQAPYDSSYNVNMLVLPTGEILVTDQSTDVEIYSSTGVAEGCIAPRITNACDLGNLTPGNTYELAGEQLNGISQGASYGDDLQAATNYPLVRLTNRASGHVSYARTHDHSSMGIAPGARSHTFFDVPAGQPAGATDLVVVANGVASPAIRVNVVAVAK